MGSISNVGAMDDWKKRSKYFERADELYREYRNNGLDHTDARLKAMHQANKEVYGYAT